MRFPFSVHAFTLAAILFFAMLPASARPPHSVHKPLTSADRQYLLSIYQNAAHMREDLVAFTMLTAKPQMTDPEWQKNMATVLVAMHIFAKQGHAVPCPHRFTGSNFLYCMGLDYYDRVYRQLPAAIGNQDAATMRECGKYLDSGSKCIKLAAKQMQGEAH